MRSIRRYFSAVVLAAVVLTVSWKPVGAQVGVAAGLNFESLSDIEAFSVKTTFDNASGYHVGLFYDLPLGFVGLRVGAFYRDLGEFDAGDSVQEQLDAIDMTMIDFPVDVRINLSTTPAVHPYLFGGPVFSLPSTGNELLDGTLESLYISGNAGIGVALDLGGIRLFPEFRYVVGISNLVKSDAEVGGVPLDVNDTHVSTVMLRLGISF
jgi:hypothetical protein